MTTGKLSVTISVDLDASTVTIRPVGTLTTRNIQVLLTLRHRAERVLPQCEVDLDSSQLRYDAAGTLDALASSGLHPGAMRHSGSNRSQPTLRQAA